MPVTSVPWLLWGGIREYQFTWKYFLHRSVHFNLCMEPQHNTLWLYIGLCNGCSYCTRITRSIIIDVLLWITILFWNNYAGLSSIYSFIRSQFICVIILKINNWVKASETVMIEHFDFWSTWVGVRYHIQLALNCTWAI